jgi:hypothetical protein
MTGSPVIARILAGPVAGRDLPADVWYPGLALADSDGNVRPGFMWTALDGRPPLLRRGRDRQYLGRPKLVI